MRRTLATVALLSILLAGCGGGSDDADTAGATTTTTVATNSATPGSIDTNFSGEGSERFCGLVRTFQERRDRLSNTDLTNLKPLIGEAQRALGELVAAAPAEIKGDAQVVSTAFTRFVQVLERVNYDATKLSPEALADLQRPEVQASTQRLEAYAQKVCGVTTSPR